MQVQPELKTLLKRLKLSGISGPLPDRYSYARQEKLDYPQFLELILGDEAERRDHVHLANRLRDAGFEEECTWERFDWSAKIRVDKPRLTELFGLHFIERHENVIFCGPVGVGKSFFPSARPLRLPRWLPGTVQPGRSALENPSPLARRQLLRPRAARLSYSRSAHRR